MTCDSKELWNNLNKKTRYGVRKSLENNLEIDISDKIELEEFYELLKEVYSKSPTANVPPIELYDQLQGTFSSKYVSVKYNDEIISAAIFVEQNSTVTYLAGASKRKHLNLYPNNFLFWHSIKYFKDKSHKKLDLLGVDSPGIGRFKKGWGGEIVESYFCVKKSFYWDICKTLVDLYNNSNESV